MQLQCSKMKVTKMTRMCYKNIILVCLKGLLMFWFWPFISSEKCNVFENERYMYIINSFTLAPGKPFTDPLLSFIKKKEVILGNLNGSSVLKQII